MRKQSRNQGTSGSHNEIEKEEGTEMGSSYNKYKYLHETNIRTYWDVLLHVEYFGDQ